MEEIAEKIFESLEAAKKPLSPSEIAEAIEHQSACDIDRQRVRMIFQTLMERVGDGSLSFDPQSPFRLRRNR